MGKVFELSMSGVRLPDSVIVDASLISALLLASCPLHHPRGPGRAAQFLQTLTALGAVGLVTPTAFAEFAIKALSHQALPAHQAAL